MRLQVIAFAVALSALVASPALGTRSERSATETIKVLPDLNGTGVKTSRTLFGYKQRYRFVVTGTIAEQGDDDDFTQSESRTWDGLFCFKGKSCGAVLLKRPDIPQGALQIAYSNDRFRGKVFYSLNRVLYAHGLPYEKYNSGHRYEFIFECRNPPGGTGNNCGHLKFRAPPGGSPNKESTYVGLYTVQITPLGDFEESPSDRLVVNFIVNASGKPNVPLRGYPSARTLVKSTVSGSGHATFTKRNASVLVATETKGTITHTDVFSDGTTQRLTLGIVSGTRYYPDLHRLALVLRVKDSDDPECDAGFIIGNTFGTLTLLPAADTGFGTAIFFGIPKTKLTGACRHAHGWSHSPGDGVRATVRVAERTP
jgi:hypothetical protein